MSPTVNLKTLEREIQRANFKDGIYDITWGLFMCSMLSPILMRIGLPKPLSILFFPVLAVLFLIFGKRYITAPRSGIARPGLKTRRKAKAVLIAGVTLNLIIIVKIILIRLGIIHLQSVPMMTSALHTSVFFITIFGFLGFITDYFTLLLVGALFGISIPASEILYPYLGEPLDTLLPFGLSAFVILGIGAINLYIFIKNNPIEMQGVSNA